MEPRTFGGSNSLPPPDVIAGNDGLGAAQEAALKLLETNYLPVSCYPLDEYIHGVQNALDGDACLICLLPPETHTERARMLTLTTFARSVGRSAYSLLLAVWKMISPL